MKQEEINILIDRYYQGISTPEEEEILKESLENTSNAEHKTIFTQIDTMSHLFDDDDTLDDSFDEKILKEISKPVRSKLYFINRTLSGVAATLLILISIWFGSTLLGPKEVYGTISNPQAAFAETKKILQEVSGNVKKGVKPVTKTIKKAESGLNKTKKVKKIEKLNSTGELLKSITKVTVDYGKS